MSSRWQRVVWAVLTAGAAVMVNVPVAPARAAAFVPPPIKHVFTILLENEELGSAFSAVAGPTGQALLSQGVLLTGYFGTGHSSLVNYIAMISGQGPNMDTKGDCEDKTTMGDPGTPAVTFDSDGQAIGKGCTYPTSLRSLPQQLDENGLTWKGYMEDMDTGPDSHRALCSNPFGDGAGLPPAPQRKGFYRDKHNPFGYFHAIFDDIATCAAKVVPMGHLDAGGTPTGPLVDDLASIATTPNYSFISPNQCNDGHDFTTGPNGVGAGPFCGDGTTVGGPPAIDAYLAKWVPVIESSPAWASGDSMLIVVFDEGITNASCCGEKKDPNLKADECNGQDQSCAFDPTGALGGGQTGAIVIAPKYVTGGRVSNAVAYNHYSYLRSMEDLFRIPEHLGYAAQSTVVPFGTDVYDKAYTLPGEPGASATPTPGPTAGGGQSGDDGLPVTGPRLPLPWLGASLVLAALLLTSRRRREKG